MSIFRYVFLWGNGWRGALGVKLRKVSSDAVVDTLAMATAIIDSLLVVSLFLSKIMQTVIAKCTTSIFKYYAIIVDVNTFFVNYHFY